MKAHTALFAALLLIVPTSILHADTATLSIIGVYDPVPCTMTLSNGGNIDLGVMPLSALNAATETPLPEKTLTVLMDCGANAANLATVASDDRAGTASVVANTNFGLGKTPGNQSIGYYRVTPEDGRVNATPGTLVKSSNGVTWTANAAADIEHTGTVWTAVGTAGDGTATAGPSAGMTTQWTLRFKPVIAPANTLQPITGPVPVSGQMTLTMVYL